MCLAIPGRITQIDASVQPVMGTVDFGGVQKLVCLEWVPGVKIGDFVIVHVGFALNTVNEDEARATLSLLDEMALREEELLNAPSTGTGE